MANLNSVQGLVIDVCGTKFVYAEEQLQRNLVTQGCTRSTHLSLNIPEKLFKRVIQPLMDTGELTEDLADLVTMLKPELQIAVVEAANKIGLRVLNRFTVIQEPIAGPAAAQCLPILDRKSYIAMLERILNESMPEDEDEVVTTYFGELYDEESGELLYKGHLTLDNFQHGLGISYHKDGSFFAGSHKAGRYEGKGLYRTPKGEFYWGEWDFVVLMHGSHRSNKVITGKPIDELNDPSCVTECVACEGPSEEILDSRVNGVSQPTFDAPPPASDSCLIAFSEAPADAFFAAAASGNVAACSKLLHENFQAVAAGGNAALLAAARGGHDAVCELLIAKLPNKIAAADNEGRIALHYAAGLGMVNVCRMLLKAVDKDTAAAMVFVSDMKDKTPLHWAAVRGHVAVCQLLLESSPQAALAVDNQGRTALHLAACGNHTGVCHMLLQRAPSLNMAVDENKSTALHLAAALCKTDVCMMLLDVNPNLISIVNGKGQTAVMIAAESGYVDLYRLLKDRVQDPVRVRAAPRDYKSQADLVEEQIQEAIRILACDPTDPQYQERVAHNAPTPANRHSDLALKGAAIAASHVTGGTVDADGKPLGNGVLGNGVLGNGELGDEEFPPMVVDGVAVTHKKVGNYTGYVNEISYPHGFGTYVGADGSKYKGQHRFGRFKGLGTYTVPDGLTSFLGDWDMYSATICTCSRCGNKELKGDMGQLNAHAATCTGGLTTPAAPPTEDEYMNVDGQQVFSGALDLHGGSFYTGQIGVSSHAMHGTGVIKWADGSIYDGEFRNNTFHGIGVFKAPGGRQVEIKGRWEGNKCQDGVCSKCQQEVKGNMWNATKHAAHCSVGEVLKVDGVVVVAGTRSIGYNRKYDGHLNDSKLPHGWGIMKWSDGSYYEGESREGSFKGRGIYYVPNGRTFFEGLWGKSEAINCPCSRCGRAVSGPPRELMKHATDCKASGPAPAIGQLAGLLPNQTTTPPLKRGKEDDCSNGRCTCCSRGNSYTAVDAQVLRQQLQSTNKVVQDQQGEIVEFHKEGCPGFS